MTASYEELLKEFFTNDRWKLEEVAVSDAKELLNDDKKRVLLKKFIERLDKDSSNRPNSWKAIDNFELLNKVQNLEDFNQEKDRIKKFCSPISDLKAVVDESSLNSFVEVQKMKIYKRVDDSHEIQEFRDYLTRKKQAKNRVCVLT